jgi:hypothetical protein
MHKHRDRAAPRRARRLNVRAAAVSRRASLTMARGTCRLLALLLMLREVPQQPLSEQQMPPCTAVSIASSSPRLSSLNPGQGTLPCMHAARVPVFWSGRVRRPGHCSKLSLMMPVSKFFSAKGQVSISCEGFTGGATRQVTVVNLYESIVHHWPLHADPADSDSVGGRDTDCGQLSESVRRGWTELRARRLDRLHDCRL